MNWCRCAASAKKFATRVEKMLGQIESLTEEE